MSSGEVVIPAMTRAPQTTEGNVFAIKNLSSIFNQSKDILLSARQAQTNESVNVIMQQSQEFGN